MKRRKVQTVVIFTVLLVSTAAGTLARRTRFRSEPKRARTAERNQQCNRSRSKPGPGQPSQYRPTHLPSTAK